MALDIEPGRQTVFVAYARHDQAFADHLAEGMAKEAQAVLQSDELEAVSDRGYYDGKEILACEEAGITVTLPKPMTSGAKAAGCFAKQDFAHPAEDDVYRCRPGIRERPRTTADLADGFICHGASANQTAERLPPSPTSLRCRR
jgi:hypothetical protein